MPIFVYYRKVEVSAAGVPDTKRVCPFYRHVFEISEGDRVFPVRQVGNKIAAESARQ